MDNLDSCLLQVVLEIKEGNGFGFLNSPLVIVAALSGNKLESAQITPSIYPQFDTQLLWQTDKKYLRRLRTGNTALKIECFNVINEHKRDRLGYILLNLKEAQIIPKGSGIPVLESWHRLLGLRNEAKAHNPELLLIFKIEEAQVEFECGVQEVHKDLPKESENMGKGDAFGERTQSYLEIGPPEGAEFFELSVNLFEAGNLYSMIPANQVGEPVHFQYSIMGSSFATDDFTDLEVNSIDGNTLLELKAQPDFLSAYFKDFPNLIFNVYCGGKVIGIAPMDVKGLANIEDGKPAIVSSKILIKSLYKKDNIIDCLSPYLEIEVKLSPKSSKFYLNEVKNIMDHPVVLKSGDPINGAFTSMSPHGAVNQAGNCTSPHTMTRSSGDAYYQNSLELNVLENEENIPQTSTDVHDSLLHQLAMKQKGMHRGDDKDVRLNFRQERFDQQINDQRSMKSDQMSEVKPKVTFLRASPNLCDVGTCTSPYLGVCRSGIGDVLPRQYVREAAHKTCEELEDWKEKQQEIYKFELKRKAEKHLKKLSTEWMKRQTELESEFLARIEECQGLRDRLEETLKDLATRTEVLNIREEEILKVKDELDRKYTMKFQELRKASKLHQYDMEDKINQIVLEKNELERRLELREKEISRLEESLLNANNVISKSQTSEVLNDVKSLQQSLEQALQSKAFYKEQWGKATRELHKLKEEEQEHLKMQYQRNREDLQTLGLVQEITQEVGEMKKDQDEINSIRHHIETLYL